MTITKDEILNAIRKAQEAQLQRPPNTYTKQELADFLEVGTYVVDGHIERMLKFGMCEKVKIQILNSRSQVVTVPGYTLKLNLDAAL